MAVSELFKRLCRYLLHRYLGPFLEEKVALDQLHLSLDKGTGTVTQLSLDAAHLNEILSKYRLPFSVVDGYIGSVTIFLPVAISTASFSSVLSVTAESFSNFGGLRLELSDVQFTIRGLDSCDTTAMGTSLDLLASSLCSSDFAPASQSLAVDYNQSIFSTGFALPLEGLDQLASVIDSIVNQVEVVVKELVVRLEPFDSPATKTNEFSIAAIELHLLKACVSLSVKDTSREVGVSLTNIEIRAETCADKGAASSQAESSYAILLRVPDASISLSTTTLSPPTFFTKVIASSLTAFFPGPDILCLVISMLDSIFNRGRPAKHQAALFESFINKDNQDPAMFESCAGSVMLSDQLSVVGNERSSPSVHLVVHVVRTAIVVAYSTPIGSLTPQSMSVAFFASLPTDFGISCSLSRNAYAVCCPADCLIVQFLSSKIDVVFNAQQPTFTLLEKEGSSSTLHNAVEWDTAVQPLRMSIHVSVDCFDFADCVRQSGLPSHQFTQILVCDDIEDARPALTFEMLVRFTGFKEIRTAVNKPCQSELDLSAIFGRVTPLVTSVLSFFLDKSSQLISPSRRCPSASTLGFRFEKLRLFVRFPKSYPFGLGYDDENALHPETLVLDTEKLAIQVTQTPASSPFSEALRDLFVECHAMNCFFQVDPLHPPVSIFRVGSLKAELFPKKRRQHTANSMDPHQETKLFADPPMRLHNGRELHVPTQAPLKFSTDDAVTIDVHVFNMSLPPISVLHLLVVRVTELKAMVGVFLERRRMEMQQVMERSVLLETTGHSIYYSMTAATSDTAITITPEIPKPQSTSFGLRFEKFLISASVSKENASSVPAGAPKARRGDLFGANAVALVAFDLAVHVAPTSGWARVGSLSLLDAYSDAQNSVTPGGLEFFSPILRSYLPPSVSPVSSSNNSDASSSSSKSQQTLVVVWKKPVDSGNRRIAARISNISLDLCSPPGKIPSCIQIICDIADSFEKEFHWSSQNVPTTSASLRNSHSLTAQSQNRWDCCVEANGISIYLRTRADQDFDGYGNSKTSSLPVLCLAVDSILFDASPTTKIIVAPGQPPIGDLWLGLANSVLQLFQESNDDVHEMIGRREKIFQADWLEFTFGLSSTRGSTSFVDICGSSISISTTVNNLSALFALCATIAGGLRNAQAGTPSTPSSGEDLFAQSPSFEAPAELKDALKESSYLTGTSPEHPGYLSARRANWNSPSTGSGRDSSDDDFLILSSSMVKRLSKKAECHKLSPASVSFKIVENHLVKPAFRPEPLSVQPHGWPTPVFRFTVRDTTVRCVLLTERGDSLEIGLLRMAVRYERCPAWTPNLYRFSASIHDVEILERHADSSQPTVICSRLVADDVPRIHSAPQVVLKVAVVRPNSCAVPLLKQNAVVPQDAEADVRVSIQPIRIRASMRTKELFQNLATKLNGLCNSSTHPTSAESVPNLLNMASSPTPSHGIKSPSHHRLAGEVGRGAPVLFDETQQRVSPTGQAGQSGRNSSSSTVHVVPSAGVFIRSFAVQPPVLLEINFSGSITTAANVPIHLDRCRLILPSLMETRSGFADVGRLTDYVSDQWKNAILSQKSAFVTAGTGLNKLTSSAQELVSATADLGALLLAPIYSEDLPPAMTVESQLRPGRVLRGITTSAASLSADVVIKLFSTAVPLLQHASTAAANLLNANQPVSGMPPRSTTPELRSVSTSSSSSSLPHHRERTSSRSQDEALRKAASSALLAGKPIETAGTIIAHEMLT